MMYRRGMLALILLCAGVAALSSCAGCQQTEYTAEVDRAAAVQAHTITAHRQLRSLPGAQSADGEWLADAQPEGGSLPEEVVVSVDGEERRVLREREPFLGTDAIVGYVWGREGELFFELSPEAFTELARSPAADDYLLYIDGAFAGAGNTGRLPEDRQWLVVPPDGVSLDQLREWFPPGPDDPMVTAGGR